MGLGGGRREVAGVGAVDKAKIVKSSFTSNITFISFCIFSRAEEKKGFIIGANRELFEQFTHNSPPPRNFASVTGPTINIERPGYLHFPGRILHFDVQLLVRKSIKTSLKSITAKKYKNYFV
jgi:hypothetical protein